MTPYKITQNGFLIFGIKKTFKLIETRPCFQGRKKEGVKIFTIIFYTSLSLKSEINVPTFSLR